MRIWLQGAALEPAGVAKFCKTRPTGLGGVILELRAANIHGTCSVRGYVLGVSDKYTEWGLFQLRYNSKASTSPLLHTKTWASKKYMDTFKITQLMRGVLLAQKPPALDAVFLAEMLSLEGNGASRQWLLQVHGDPRPGILPGTRPGHRKFPENSCRTEELRDHLAEALREARPAPPGEVRLPGRTPRQGMGGRRAAFAKGSHTCSCLIVSPPLPMTRPTLDAGIRSSWIVLLPSMSL